MSEHDSKMISAGERLKYCEEDIKKLLLLLARYETIPATYSVRAHAQVHRQSRRLFEILVGT